METSVGLSNVEGRGNLNSFTFPCPQQNERTLESECGRWKVKVEDCLMTSKMESERKPEKTWNRPPAFWWTFQRQEKGNISNSFTFPSPQKNERTLESEMDGSIRRTFQRQVKENKNRKFTIFTVQKITSP